MLLCNGGKVKVVVFGLVGVVVLCKGGKVKVVVFGLVGVVVLCKGGKVKFEVCAELRLRDHAKTFLKIGKIGPFQN